MVINGKKSIICKFLMNFIITIYSITNNYCCIEIFYGKGLQFVFMLHNLQIHEGKTVFVFITYVEYGTFGAIRIMYQHYGQFFIS